ncbi:hypothetical protein J6590_047532 [Homalodisca vitripennis]|nr:hypothetical protein J6590_047532 [Homalodisca vitripennis]
MLFAHTERLIVPSIVTDSSRLITLAWKCLAHHFGIGLWSSTTRASSSGNQELSPIEVDLFARKQLHTVLGGFRRDSGEPFLQDVGIDLGSVQKDKLSDNIKKRRLQGSGLLTLGMGLPRAATALAALLAVRCICGTWQHACSPVGRCPFAGGHGGNSSLRKENYLCLGDRQRQTMKLHPLVDSAHNETELGVACSTFLAAINEA